MDRKVKRVDKDKFYFFIKENMALGYKKESGEIEDEIRFCVKNYFNSSKEAEIYRDKIMKLLSTINN